MCDSNRYHAHVQNASTAPQRGHVALFEPFAERCDSLCGVAANTIQGGVGALNAAKVAFIEATKSVVVQAASISASMCEMNRYHTHTDTSAQKKSAHCSWL